MLILKLGMLNGRMVLLLVGIVFFKDEMVLFLLFELKVLSGREMIVYFVEVIVGWSGDLFVFLKVVEREWW